MPKLIYVVLMIAALPIGCWTAHSETTNATLTFYVVSEATIEGGSFIDTPDLPRLGYIAAKPDLAVTNLKEVYPQKMADQDIVVDKDGKYTVVPTHPLPGLGLALRAEDAKRFTALTERSIGKRLLIMFGGKPLKTLKVLGPIEGGRFLIQFRDQADLKRVESDLKKLIR